MRATGQSHRPLRHERERTSLLERSSAPGCENRTRGAATYRQEDYGAASRRLNASMLAIGVGSTPFSIASQKLR